MTDKNDQASLAATAFAEGPPPAPAGTSGSGTQPAAVASGPIGKTIKGRYKIKRLIGEGGMGGVYEGEHLEIGKRVAIKLVHSLHARDGHIAARIKQEARSTSAIESEHIVQVFDAGEDEELGLFLVMELLKGEDLANILGRRKRLGAASSAMLIAQAAQGLARAHAAGIVHRDLKPANVFVIPRDDGSSLVKLVDFGIAKLVREANQQAQGNAGGLTRMGMVIGTPQYMSPEQAQGLPTVDHRTDIYSLGAVLFEAIVGQSPFPEMPTYEQTILQIMTRPAPRLSQSMPDIHPELDRLCSEMMAMDPNHRPQDMSTVRERLLAIFPEIQNARMPMKSLTSEVGFEVTAFAGGPVSGEVQRMIDNARRATGSGVGLAGMRPATNSAVAVAAAHGIDPDESQQIAGIPRKRPLAGIIAASSVLALAAIIGVVALVRTRGASEQKSAGGYGLVQSTVSTVAQPVVTTPVAPVVTAAPQVQLPAAATPTPAPAATTKTASAPATHSGSHHSHPSKNTPTGAVAPAAPAAPAAAADPSPASRPVGGTGVSTEF